MKRAASEEQQKGALPSGSQKVTVGMASEELAASRSFRGAHGARVQASAPLRSDDSCAERQLWGRRGNMDELGCQHGGWGGGFYNQHVTEGQ